MDVFLNVWAVFRLSVIFCQKGWDIYPCFSVFVIFSLSELSNKRIGTLLRKVAIISATLHKKGRNASLHGDVVFTLAASLELSSHHLNVVFQKLQVFAPLHHSPWKCTLYSDEHLSCRHSWMLQVCLCQQIFSLLSESSLSAYLSLTYDYGIMLWFSFSACVFLFSSFS